MAVAPEDMTFDDMEAACAGHFCRALPKAFVSAPLPRGSWNHTNFPMMEVREIDLTPMTHFIEVITGHRMETPFEDVELNYKKAIDNQDLQLLPPPFGPKTMVPNTVKLQMVIVEENDATVTIFKHYFFANKAKASYVKSIACGSLYRPSFMAQKLQTGKKILQYCLQNMGGRQFRCFDLTTDVPSGQSKHKAFEDLDDDGLERGFDFLRKNAPRSGSDLQQLAWQTKEIRKKTSPIHAWPISLVEKALRCLSADGALARKEFNWPIPLTETFFQKWILEKLEKIWNFDVAALVMLGEPNTGKSPLGRSILMAQCRYNQTHFNREEAPCIRCTPEVDFLRGESGSVIMGDFLDDPEMQHVGLKILKSFLDVGLYESMAWARWGASKWVQNQPRAIAANAYDTSVDEGHVVVGTLPFKNFWEMIRPAMTVNATHADINAILKRSVFIVVTKQFVYFRPDGVNENPVERIAVDGPDFLTDAGKELYSMFKCNKQMYPPNFEDEVKKEQAWVSLLMKKRAESRQSQHKVREQLREALWGSSSTSSTSLDEVRAKATAEKENQIHSIPFVKMEVQEHLGI